MSLKGVEMREKSIRIGFSLNGVWTRETLLWQPNPVNERRAANLLIQIRKAIKSGTFDYPSFFPDSKTAIAHAQFYPVEPKVVRIKAPLKELKFGAYCDLWLTTRGRLAIKTQTQYRNAINVWKGMFGESTNIATISHLKVATKIGKHPWASAKLLNNYLVSLRGVFTRACRELKIENPMLRATLIKSHPGP